MKVVAFLRAFLDRPIFRRVAKNVGWVVLDQGVRLLVGFYVGLRVARHLGPDGFGMFSYSVAYIGLFAPLVALGTDRIVVRNIVARPDAEAETMGTACLLRGAAGVVALLAAPLLAVMFYIDAPTVGLIRWLSIIPMFQMFDVFDYWFQARVRVFPSIAARQVAFIASASWRLHLVSVGGTPMDFVQVMVVEALICAVGLGALFRFSGGDWRRWRMSFSRAVALLREGWPLMLSGFAVLVYMKIDQVMLGWMVDAKTVGYYAAAVRLSELWFFLPPSLMTILLPVLVRLKATDEALYRRRWVHVFQGVSLASWGIVLGMVFLAEPAVAATFGPEFHESARILKVHVWGTLLFFPACVQGIWEIAENRTRISLAKTLVGAVTNIGLNLWLIPTWGGMGAAIATLAAYAVSGPVMTYAFPSTRAMFWVQMRALIPSLRAG